MNFVQYKDNIGAQSEGHLNFTVPGIVVTYNGFKIVPIVFTLVLHSILQTFLVKSSLESLGTVVLLQGILLIMFNLHFQLHVISLAQRELNQLAKYWCRN